MTHKYQAWTRLVVIDHTTGGEGRVFDKSDVVIELQTQDDGQTLKVFVTEGQES